MKKGEGRETDLWSGTLTWMFHLQQKKKEFGDSQNNPRKYLLSIS